MQKLKWIPPQLEADLQHNSQSKAARLALLKLYRQQAEGGRESALEEIVGYCGDVSQDVAKEAAWMVLEFARQGREISVAGLVPILSQGRVVSVRQNCLQAIVMRVNAGAVVPEEIVRVFAAISQERSPEVLHVAYDLARAAIWNHPSGDRRLEWPIADALFELTRQVVGEGNQRTLDAIANAASICLNQMLLLEEKALIGGVMDCTRLLLRRVDIRGKIDNTMVTGLLNGLGKFDPQFLERMVVEDVLNGERMLPVANLQALVVAISNNQGKLSPLLDRLLLDPGVPSETKSRILRDRNL